MPDPAPIWPDPTHANATLRLMPAAVGPDAAVLVLPGGGYAALADHEAEQVAQKFVEAGINGVGLADGGDGRPHRPEAATWIDLAIPFVQRHLKPAGA